MGWARRIEQIRKIRTAYKTFLGNFNGRDHLQALDIDGRAILKINLREIDKKYVQNIRIPEGRRSYPTNGRIILKLILSKEDLRVWTGFI
jgi:hypothetical protein